MRVLLIVVGSLVALSVALWAVGLLRQHLANNKAKERFWKTAETGSTTIAKNATTVAELPPIVRRYLERSIPAGTTVPRQIELAQSGEMRLAPDKPWMALSATQLFSARPYAFVWQAKIHAAPLLSFHALDALAECRGTFSGALLGLVRIVGAYGPEVDVSTLLRYLSEAVWMPHVLLPSSAIRWESTESPQEARALLTCGDISVSGVFRFDDQARPVEFFTDERYRDVDGRPVRTDWRIEYLRHQRIHGVEIPREGSVSWILQDGPFETIRLHVKEVRKIP
jgi:hypothetical protein